MARKLGLLELDVGLLRVLLQLMHEDAGVAPL